MDEHTTPKTFMLAPNEEQSNALVLYSQLTEAYLH